MDINRKNYELFVLGVFNHPGMQLDRIQSDIKCDDGLPSSHFMHTLVQEFVTNYTEEELIVTEKVIIDHHVDRLSTLMAIEMLATGKSTINTWQEVLLLPDDCIDDVIQTTQIKASHMDKRVRNNETRTDSHTFNGTL